MGRRRIHCRKTDWPEWQITLFIQNASELPVEVHVAQLAVDTVGYKDLRLRRKRIGFVKSVRFSREQSRLGANGRASRSAPRTSGPPRTSTPGSVRTRIGIERLAITDAAGRKWEVRPVPRHASPPGPVAARVAVECRAAPGAEMEHLSQAPGSVPTSLVSSGSASTRVYIPLPG